MGRDDPLQLLQVEAGQARNRMPDLVQFSDQRQATHISVAVQALTTGRARGP
jgi:hypothetical protein